MGFSVITLPVGFHFEGAGDALFCGETLFAGYRFRSDARSHQWLGQRLGVEVLPLELVDVGDLLLADGVARHLRGDEDDDPAEDGDAAVRGAPSARL